MNICTLKDINFSFASSKPILENFSITLEEGKIYALMGVNGAGKSTLFNILTGFIQPKSGKVFFQKKDITCIKPFKRNLMGIGRTFQDLRLVTNLSVIENVILSFKNNLSEKWYNAVFLTNKLKKQQKLFRKQAIAVLKQFQLIEVQNQLAGEISYGQQKLLTIACCVANDAELFLLDEPVAGVNAIYIEQLVGILKALKDDNKTILLIEHNTEFISKVVDCIYFLTNGNLIQFENLKEMRNNVNVINTYM